MPPHPISPRPIIILSTHLHLGLLSGFFISGFSPLIYMYCFSPYSCYMPSSSHLPWLHNSNYTWRRIQVTKLFNMQLPPASRHFIFFGSNILITISSLKNSYLISWQTISLRRCQYTITWYEISIILRVPTNNHKKNRWNIYYVYLLMLIRYISHWYITLKQ
jgi:hypothetical protein